MSNAWSPIIFFVDKNIFFFFTFGHYPYLKMLRPVMRDVTCQQFKNLTKAHSFNYLLFNVWIVFLLCIYLKEENQSFLCNFPDSKQTTGREVQPIMLNVAQLSGKFLKMLLCAELRLSKLFWYGKALYTSFLSHTHTSGERCELPHATEHSQ